MEKIDKMEINNYREQPAGAKFIAYFDVYFPALQLTLRNLKLIRSQKGHHFIGFPAFCEDFHGAEKKFIPYMEFSKDRGQEFQTKCKELLEDMMGVKL